MENYPIIKKISAKAIVYLLFSPFFAAVAIEMMPDERHRRLSSFTSNFIFYTFGAVLMLVALGMLVVGLTTIRTKCYSILCPHCSTNLFFPISKQQSSCPTCKILLVQTNEGIVSTGNVVESENDTDDLK